MTARKRKTTMDFEAIASYFEINTRSRERRGKSYVSRKEKMKWLYILKTGA